MSMTACKECNNSISTKAGAARIAVLDDATAQASEFLAPYSAWASGR